MMNVVQQILHGILPFPETAYSPAAASETVEYSFLHHAASQAFADGSEGDSGTAVTAWGLGNDPPRVITGHDIQQLSCGCYHTAVLTRMSVLLLGSNLIISCGFVFTR
jgi:hypothetical protein